MSREKAGDRVTVHARLGVATIVVAGAGALLAMLARRRPAYVPAVRVFVRLCAAAGAVEALIGLALIIGGQRPAEGIHFFYGAATVLPVPVAEVLARRVRAREQMLYLMYGAVAMVLFGIRAATTGSS